MLYLSLVYYGNFLNYFQLYLDSLEANSDVLRIFLITDIDMQNYVIPKNVIVKHMKLNEIKLKICTFIKNEYNVDMHAEKIITKPYKLCDLRPIYPILFSDIYDEFVTEEDHIGYCDCDVIMGKISNFINLNNNYDLIGMHGHFTAYKNNNEFKYLYKNIPNYFQIITDDVHHSADERVFRNELLNHVKKNKLKMFTVAKVFCDVLPNSKKSEEFKNTTSIFSINYLIFDKKSGILTVYYENNIKSETIYVHLQKRPMIYNNENYNAIKITKNSFEIIS